MNTRFFIRLMQCLSTACMIGILASSIFGLTQFDTIQLLAYTSNSEKNKQQKLSPNEINKVEAYCQNNGSDKTVRVNTMVDCTLKLPSDRSLPYDVIVSIGNDYQKSSRTLCNFQPNYDNYRCRNVYAFIQEGRQNIYLKINGNTESTGDTVEVNSGKLKILPINKIKDLEIECLDAVTNSDVTCTFKNMPENYILPTKASMHIGSEKKNNNCIYGTCLAHAGASSQSHRVTVSYPGSNEQFETKSDAIILPSNITELATNDYNQLIVNCDDAQRNSTTNCEVRLPENKAIVKSYRDPSINISGSRKYRECNRKDNVFTCEKVPTGIEVGDVKILAKSGGLHDYAFGLTTSSTVKITSNDTTPFTIEDIRNTKLGCRPEKINVNSLTYCTLTIPEGKRIDKEALSMSIGENGRKSTCYSPQVAYLTCPIIGYEPGKGNVYIHMDNTAVKKSPIITVEKFEIISERDLPNMDARCFDSSSKSKDVDWLLACEFKTPDGRTLPRGAYIKIEGTDYTAPCSSRCSLVRRDDKTGLHKVVLAGLGNGNTIILDEVNLLDREEQREISRNRSREYAAKRNSYQFNFGQSTKLENHILDTGSAIEPNANKFDFGWNRDHQNEVRDDTTTQTPTPVHDGLRGYARFRDGENDVWTINNIDNGQYRVEVIVGTPSYDDRALHHIVANNQTVIKCNPTSESRWCEGRTEIKVSNNKIEIKKGNDGNNVNLNLVRIQKVL